MFGFQARGLNDARIVSEMSDWAIEDLTPLRELALQRTQQAQQLAKERYNAKRAGSNGFDVGELVLLRKEKTANEGQSRKLMRCYEGPYVIGKVLPHDRYLVMDVPAMRLQQKP